MVPLVSSIHWQPHWTMNTTWIPGTLWSWPDVILASSHIITYFHNIFIELSITVGWNSSLRAVCTIISCSVSILFLKIYTIVTRRKLCSVERCSVLLNPSNIMRLCWSVFVFRTPSDAVVHHSLNTPIASAPSLPGNYKHNVSVSILKISNSALVFCTPPPPKTHPPLHLLTK
jgi:hypothetical protein